MKNRPIISIIVPVYNVERYLERCINSILNQTFKNFELILVDDGSTDKSGEICDSFAGYDKRIRVIHKKNGGLSSARNVGLDVSIGKYIGFVDSDDWIDEFMYEKLYRNMIKTKSDIVICNFSRVYEENLNMVKSNIYNNKVRVFNNIETLEQLYNDKYIFVVAWNKLYKKELFDEIKYKEGVICEDEFIAPYLLYKCKRTAYIPDSLYYYYQREGSIINSKFNAKRLDKIKALSDRIYFFKNIGEVGLMRKAEKAYMDNMLWAYYLAKRKLSNIEGKLVDIKKDFNKLLIQILKNPLFTWRQKVAFLLFWISPNIYGKIIKFD